MDLKQIIEDIKGFIETAQEVTVFQIMAEKNYSLLDVGNTVDLCVREGMLTQNGDVYVVVPKDKRVSLKEKMQGKIQSILDALSNEEIEFLKDATDRRARSMFETYCKKDTNKFFRFFKHFQQLQLFTGDENNFKLSLGEEEYLCMWKLLDDYPKKKERSKPNPDHIDSFDELFFETQDSDDDDDDDDDDEEAAYIRFRKARMALERRKAEILRELREESEDEDDDEDEHEDDDKHEDDPGDIGEIWYDNNHCVIAEIQRHVRKNRMHSRLELVNDIKNTLSNAKQAFRSQFLEKAIINLIMMSDEDFERVKKHFCE